MRLKLFAASILVPILLLMGTGPASASANSVVMSSYGAPVPVNTSLVLHDLSIRYETGTGSTVQCESFDMLATLNSNRTSSLDITERGNPTRSGTSCWGPSIYGVDELKYAGFEGLELLGPAEQESSYGTGAMRFWFEIHFPGLAPEEDCGALVTVPLSYWAGGNASLSFESAIIEEVVESPSCGPYNPDASVRLGGASVTEEDGHPVQIAFE